MRLQEALQECTLALLRRIARCHQIAEDEASLRSELAAKIQARLLQPGYLDEFVATVGPDEQPVLETMARDGWSTKGFVLDRQFPRTASDRSTGVEAAPSSPLASLLQKGLVYRSFGMIGSWRGELYHVPEEIRTALPAILPSAPAAPVRGVPAAGAPRTQQERNGHFDVFCLLSFLRRGERRTAQGVLSRSDLLKLEAEAVSASNEPEGLRAEERWRFLLHVCLAGGWVRRDGAMLRPGRDAGRLLAGSPAEVRKRLLDRYLRDRAWSELAAAGRIRQSLGSRRIDEALGRQLLLHYLEELLRSDWVDEERFIQAVFARNPDFLREDYGSPSWAVVDVATDAEVWGPNSWDAVEGEWLRYILRGPLYWLGLVRLGTGTDGRQLLQPRRESEAAEQSHLLMDSALQPGVEVKEDLTVTAHATTDLANLYRLERYLDLRHRGVTSEYRFTRSAVVDGLEKGGSWDELRELLHVAACSAVPPKVLETLQAWTSEYGRVEIESAVLLSAATWEDAEAAAGIPAVAACIEARIGPRSFKVTPEKVRDLVARLREAGHLPRVQPGVAGQVGRAGPQNPAVLREALFALRVLRSIGGSQLESSDEAVKWLEAALDPEESREVARKSSDAAKRLLAEFRGAP